ncbi:uracil-DNA glycosylase family protein [Tepidibacter hydrothermalis]|uniref:Uracil-DNA glycosylase-like domain-containing protein n=1 Tax=Tepidibacter hydrothermalis TaxID=3036126 RepID=A0ABY8E9Q7_9FIRM|nr:uracil-DNA glycosylase family protein [Tepidibacter hydrothermalis]WFD08665.1 hypothetical protein P4S50_09650 [Tepidibacter hydrothermalis]
MIYDSRIVDIHYDTMVNSIPILLMNEAPGPREAESGIPLFGHQGSNLYRTLLNFNINWVANFNNNQSFTWPIKLRDEYKKLTLKNETNLILKDDFLNLRKKYIACTNSYPRWPKSSPDSTDFVDPNKRDVISNDNLERIRNEIQLVQPRILLICGEFAYLACTGNVLQNPAQLEFQEIIENDKDQIELRLQYKFELIIYMGHTRRWNFNRTKLLSTFNEIKNHLDW